MIKYLNMNKHNYLESYIGNCMYQHIFDLSNYFDSFYNDYITYEANIDQIILDLTEQDNKTS